jgi:DNA-binding LytR/AlgR family response regulator
MRILIVDDEAPARARLKRLLGEIEGVEVLAEAENGVQALERIEQERPDLVLLDIQMPGLDGFGVVESLEKPPAVVFVTAYDEYAIRAFEVNALDYLLKPFSKDRLALAIQRAREAQAGGADLSAQLGLLLQSLASQGQFISRLAVRHGHNIRVIPVAAVDWMGVEQEQTRVHVGDEVFPLRRTLSELENCLDPACFFRANRSAIVNLDRVAEIVPWFKGGYKLRLASGAEIELSRAKARALRTLLNW